MSNNGGLLNGLGYLGQKLVGGTVGAIEGIWDYAAGGIAQLARNNEWAKEQFDSDWIDYEAPDNWFEPDDTWKFFGDVAGGVGNSVPSILLGLATGGAGFWPSLGATFGMSFLSAGGNAVKEAAKEQGDLNGEAWAYGSLVGLLEGSIETISAGLGVGGLGASLKAAGKGAAKGAGSTLVSTLWDGFKGEFVEEAISAALTPYIKRATYDKNAEDASVGEILYSGLVGGISGMITSGGAYGINKVYNTVTGAKISRDEAKTANVLELAKRINNVEDENVDTSPVFQEVKKTYKELEESLKNTGGQITTAEQREKLGYLNRKLGESALYPEIVRAAATLLADPNATVENINNFYNEEKITLDELTKGLPDTNISSKKFKKNIYKALGNNDTLRNLTVMQALGQLSMNAQKYANSMFGDTPISNVATQENINRFVESENPDVVNAVSSALGIDMYTATADQLAAALGQARLNKSGAQYESGVKAIKAARSAPAAKRELPTVITRQKNGAVRYKLGDSEVAIIKDGDKYRLFDFATGNLSKEMNASEIIELTKSLKKSVVASETSNKGENASPDAENAKNDKKTVSRKELNKAVKDFCNKNVPEYKRLTESEKSSVRMTVRQALMQGMSETDAALLGRIAAQSGMNINVRDDIKGEDVFYDGNNSVYVNASANNKDIYRGLLGKEMIKKLFKDDKGGKDLYKKAIKNVDPDKKKEILNKYKEKCKDLNLSDEEIKSVSSEEAANAYAEELLGIDGVWEYILAEEPSFKDRVLNFFKRKTKSFLTDKVGDEAEKWLEKYKKYFLGLSKTNKSQGGFENSVRRYTVLNQENNNVNFDGVLNQNKKTNEETEDGVRLRDGSERSGSEDTEGQIPGVEEDTGKIEGGQKESRPADSEAARLADEGQEVKLLDIGITQATPESKIKLIAPENDTTLMKAARKMAKERGVKVAFFAGSNMNLTTADGQEMSVRGYISADGRKVFIRADHPRYTSEQLMRHELGHDMIAKGEVDTDKARERLEKTVGKENVDKVAELYAEAYAGSGMSAEEIFEEFVCDSLGDMNVFSKKNAKKLLEKVIPETKKAASESKSENKTRGSPEDSVGKASRELDVEAADGAAVKAKAEYTNDRVFNKSEALTAIRSIKGAEQLKAKEREALAIKLWVGLNKKVTEKNRQKQLADLADGLYEDMSNMLNSENATEVVTLKIRVDEAVKDLYKNGAHESRKARIETREKNIDEEIKNTSNAIYDDKERRFESMKARHREQVKKAVAQGKENTRNALEREKEYNRKVLENTREQNDNRFESMKTRHRKQLNTREAYYEATLALDRTVRSLRKKIEGDKFTNATVYKDANLKKLLSEVLAFEYRETFSTNKVREKVGNLLKWYNKDNPAFLYNNENDPGIYLESVRNTIEALSNGKGQMTSDELRALDGVIKYMAHTAETFDQVYLNDKWASGKDLSERFIKEIKTNEKVLKGDVVLHRNRYIAAFGTPETVMLGADGFTDGFFTTMYKSLREGEVNADIAVMEISREVEDFLGDRKNKKYVKSLTERNVDLDGAKLTKIELIGYYMTLKREQSWETLAYNGFVVTDESGKDIKISGLSEVKKDLTQKQLEDLAAQKRNEISKLLTENDRKLISLLEAAYKTTKELKINADITRFGIENVIDGYYYPLKRKYLGTKTIDPSAEASYVDRFTYASYNKHTKDHAQQPLFIGSALDTFYNHIRGIAYYANVSPVIDSYNKLYKLNMSGNPNDTTTIETVLSQSKSTWRDKNGQVIGNKYFKDLVYNIENGSYARNDVGGGAIARIRGGAAVSALALNPKVWVTQFSSLLASSSMLSKRALVRGTFSVSGADVDKYCKLAELRNREHAVVKAQGVIDKVSGIGAKTTSMISVFDRIVIKRLFASCQAEVELQGGAKIGTEENKIAAGKMLENVILETQQNSFVTSKTSAARNGGEFMKGLMMFKSDAVQVQGKIINEKGRIMAIKRKLADESLTSEEKTKLKEELKKVKKNGRKAIGALIASATFMLAVSHLFKHIYNKDKEEFGGALFEWIGNLLGGLPGIADVYEYFVSGYDLENMEMSAINDLLSAATSAYDFVEKFISGKADTRDKAGIAKKLAFALGPASGLPFRNVYNTITGLIRRFDETTGYKIDDFFKKQNYDKDFAEEAKKGKNELAKDILSMAFEENIGEGASDETLTEFVRLANTKYNVVPSEIAKSITIDGESYELTEDEREIVREIYSEAIPQLNKLIASRGYQKLDDKQRQKKIKALLSRYRKMGYDEVKETSYGVSANNSSTSKYSGMFKNKGSESGKNNPYSGLFGSKTTSASKKSPYASLLSGKRA